MKRSSLTFGLLMMLGIGGACQAQQIDTSHSRVVALANTAGGQGYSSAAMDGQAMRAPVTTRAMVHRDANGKMAVRCHVTLPRANQIHRLGHDNKPPRRTK